MNFPAYLHIKGTQQGLITEGASTPGSVGNKWQEGHEDEILVQGFSHDMVTTNGLREHKPLVVWKEPDKSSPLLRAALVSGENLEACHLRVNRQNRLGELENYFTISLHDAVITDVQLEALPQPEAAENTGEMPWLLEKLSLSYRKIEFRHEISNTVMHDIWEQGSPEAQ